MRTNLKVKNISPLLLVLVGLSFLTFLRPLTLPLGSTFTSSSLFFLLLLRVYGFKVTLIINLVVQVISVIFFDVTPLNLFSFIEIIFFAIIFRFKPKVNIVLLGTAFWVLICGPISLVIYHSVYNISGDLLLFQVFTGVFNGFLNIFIVDMLLTYLPLRQWKEGKRSKRTFRLKKILLHFSFIAMILPFLLYVSVSSLNAIELHESNLNQVAENVTKQVITELKNWSTEDTLGLQLNGEIQKGYLEDIIGHIAEQNQYELTVTGSDGSVIASSKESAQKKELYTWSNHAIYELTPTFYRLVPDVSKIGIKNWSEGFYVYESDIGIPSHNIYVEIPIRPFQHDVINGFLNQLGFVMSLLLISFLFSNFIYRLLARTIHNLAVTTTGLPAKLHQIETVVWPTSRIVEIRALTANFQNMFGILKNMFDESRSINEELINQAEKLKISEKKLQTLAYFDVLTGLPNRQFFQNTLSRVIKHANENDKKVALLYLDLNQFKQINDTLGHTVGDELLKLIATKLHSIKSETIHPYRLSGDEFVVIMTDVEGKQEVMNTATRLKGMFEQPVVLMNHKHHVSSSIGISIFPDDAKDKETLIQNADIAMYRSKNHEGTTIAFFYEEMRAEYLEEVILTNDLRSAVTDNQFELYYQPKVNHNHRITSIEALVRWHHPTLGMVSPGTFIPLAEEAGLIKTIDEWVINEACKQNKQWQDEGYPMICISVNISAKHFYQSNVIDMIEKALHHSQLDAKYLQIELTESVFIENMELVVQITQKIRDLGVLISIDDFGKGFSSLTHLVKLPIAEVKLDKEFIKGIEVDYKKAMVVQSIVELARNLSFRVVVEGVETQAELTKLKQIGCDEMQGYLFSKPIPKEKFGELFASSNSLLEEKEKISGEEV